jgi:two-component system invasion response regulator UvrY
MINVMIVDDHDIVRAGISRLLNDAPGIQVVAEAASGEEAVRTVAQAMPHVLLMDVNMPGMGGIAATRRLKKENPQMNIIVLSVHADEPFLSHMLAAGASGYLTKGCGVDEIIAAIRAVHKGAQYLGSQVRERVKSQDTAARSESSLDLLSEREMQVLLLITQGHRMQSISDQLCLSPKTISTYRTRIYEKLGAGNDVELARIAMSYGIIDPLSVGLDAHPKGDAEDGE